MQQMHSVLYRMLETVLPRVDCILMNTYTPYEQCTVFAALRLARVSAKIWFVHVMALFREFTVHTIFD